MVGQPPSPFDPLLERWEPERRLYRVYGQRRRATEFNAGVGASTRWAFFGDPPVPVLYAAASEEAAVAETILHDIPLRGGRIFPENYLDCVMARLTCRRALALAQFCGPGLRHLGVRARSLTDTEAGTYARTVAWAQVVWKHTACDGIVWMSRHWNTDRAVVLFGDRISARELRQDSGFARAFANPADIEWLAALCEQTRVAFTPPTP